MNKYEEMKYAGATAQEVGVALRKDGKEFGETVRVLRSLYSLSLAQAKEIYITADGTDLERYRQEQVDAAEHYFASEEQESDSLNPVSIARKNSA